MNRPEIPLVQPLAPPFERFEALFRPCWESGQLSNMGPLHQELEATLARRLGAPLTLVSNGTLALVLALRALGLTDGEVVTTPFTFAATILAISLAGLTPKLADIDNETLCLSPLEAEKAITPETCAILPVHVFGRICDVASFDSLSREYGLKVVYDGAHAFDRREEGLPSPNTATRRPIASTPPSSFIPSRGALWRFPVSPRPTQTPSSCAISACGERACCSPDSTPSCPRPTARRVFPCSPWWRRSVPAAGHRPGIYRRTGRTGGH